jgi:hypothetical protein
MPGPWQSTVTLYPSRPSANRPRSSRLCPSEKTVDVSVLASDDKQPKFPVALVFVRSSTVGVR